MITDVYLADALPNALRRDSDNGHALIKNGEANVVCVRKDGDKVRVVIRASHLSAATDVMTAMVQQVDGTAETLVPMKDQRGVFLLDEGKLSFMTTIAVADAAQAVATLRGVLQCPHTPGAPTNIISLFRPPSPVV